MPAEPARPDTRPTRVTHLTRNGFIPLVPVIAWNLVAAGRLPAMYGADTGVPAWLLVVETALRVLVFGWPLLLTLGLDDAARRWGLALYVVGIVAYGLSWLPPLATGAPPVDPLLALAPYWTPAILLTGVGLMGRSRWYPVAVAAFSLAHVAHGAIALT